MQFGFMNVMWPSSRSMKKKITTLKMSTWAAKKVWSPLCNKSTLKKLKFWYLNKFCASISRHSIYMLYPASLVFQ